LEDLGVDGRIILKIILKEQCERVWTGFILIRTESLSFIEGGKFLD
jgi:hypothetical protein